MAIKYVRKRSPKEQAERAFARRYSRFKLWISFLDGNNADFFEYEAEESILQIMFNKVNTVTLNNHNGYLALVNLVKQYAGKFQTAIIYDQYRSSQLPNGSKTQGRAIEKYNRAGLRIEWEEMDWSEPKTFCDVVRPPDEPWHLVRRNNRFKN